MKYKQLSNNVIALSIIVGLISGIAAIILKNLIDILEHWARLLHRQGQGNFLFYLLPMLGLALSVLIIRFLCSGKLEKGLSHVMYIIAKKSSKIPLKHTYGHILTSAVSIGFGGSAGLEAPIVFTGAAIGSNVSQHVNTDYTLRTLLSACGAAAGIAAIFNAPIGGVIFAFEVLLPQLSVPYLVPLLLSSATASVLSKFFYSGQLFSVVSADWVLKAVPYYILLGIFCGIVSIYIIKVVSGTESLFKRIPSKVLKIIAGGGAIAVLIFLLLPLYGEGYSTVRILLEGRKSFDKIPGGWLSEISSNNMLFILTSIILLKPFAAALTNAGGGNGGIIAPSLLIGALTGFLFTEALFIAGLVDLNTKNFVLAGMVGILSGVVHAPLSAIFIITELTGSFILFIPLMLVSAISYFISKSVLKDSIYTMVLKKEGIKFRGNINKDIIHQIELESVIETDFEVLLTTKTLRQVIPAILKSKRTVFIAVDNAGQYCGMVYLDDIRETLAETEYLDIILVGEVTRMNIPVITIETPVEEILALFEKEKYWHFPVLKNNIYIGMISRANLVNRVFTLEHEENDLI
ncbi:MAG: chloride channel protein [Ignavibacteriales bacterium]|nr:chloride channel protein [Ignavibacteriales bacterium]